MNGMKKFKELCMYRTFSCAILAGVFLIMALYSESDIEEMRNFIFAGSCAIFAVVSSFFWELCNARKEEIEQLKKLYSKEE